MLPIFNKEKRNYEESIQKYNQTMSNVYSLIDFYASHENFDLCERLDETIDKLKTKRNNVITNYLSLNGKSDTSVVIDKYVSSFELESAIEKINDKRIRKLRLKEYGIEIDEPSKKIHRLLDNETDSNEHGIKGKIYSVLNSIF